jgi:hypothetical protein
MSDLPQSFHFIDLINNTDSSLNIYVVDGAGNENLVCAIEPNGTTRQLTFPGATWIARPNIREQRLVAKAGSHTYLISPDSIQQVTATQGLEMSVGITSPTVTIAPTPPEDSSGDLTDQLRSIGQTDSMEAIG